jgi:hypothetical protein
MGRRPNTDGQFRYSKESEIALFLCSIAHFPTQSPGTQARKPEELPAFTLRTQQALNQNRPAAVILKTKGYYVLAFRYPSH